jgi:hypothetical protein
MPIMYTSPFTTPLRSVNQSPSSVPVSQSFVETEGQDANGASLDAIRRVIFGPQLQLLRDEVNEFKTSLRREFDGLRTTVQRRFEEFEARVNFDLAQTQQQCRDTAARTLQAALSCESKQTPKPQTNLSSVEESLRDEIAMSAAEVSRQFRTLLDERLEEHFGADIGREQIAHAMELMLMRDNIASTKLMESIQ